MAYIIYKEMDLNEKNSTWIEKIHITHRNKTVYCGELDLNNPHILRLLKKYCRDSYPELLKKYNKGRNSNDKN